MRRTLLSVLIALLLALVFFGRTFAPLEWLVPLAIICAIGIGVVYLLTPKGDGPQGGRDKE